MCLLQLQGGIDLGTHYVERQTVHSVYTGQTHWYRRRSTGIPKTNKRELEVSTVAILGHDPPKRMLLAPPILNKSEQKENVTLSRCSSDVHAILQSKVQVRCVCVCVKPEISKSEGPENYIFVHTLVTETLHTNS